MTLSDVIGAMRVTFAEVVPPLRAVGLSDDQIKEILAELLKREKAIRV